MGIYCKNGHVVCREPKTDAGTGVDARFAGRTVSTPKGRTTDGGLILLGADKLTTSATCHEVEVVASKTDDLQPGDRVIVYIGGDDGAVTANGISAFVPINGVDHFIVHDRFVWARVRDGEILPRGKVVLTERNDEAFRRHVLGPAALLHMPGVLERLGVSATGAEDGANSGEMYAVTALYETVYRTGPAVTNVARGAVVCFSPSYSAARLSKGMGTATRHFHLVDSEELYFSEG